jgi:hypothetical protein
MLLCEKNDYELSTDSVENEMTAQTISMAESLSVPSSESSSSTEVHAKRVVTEQEIAKETKHPVNRTLFINCTSGEWVCTKLKCRTELLFSHQVASLELKMHLDMSILGKKDSMRPKLLNELLKYYNLNNNKFSHSK